MDKLLCGVDLGGSKLSAGLFRPDGTLIEKRLIHSHISMDEEGITRSVVDLINNLLNSLGIGEDSLAGIGIGVAGHVNFHKGIIITASNFKTSFCNYPLKEKIAASFNVPVYMDNDANAQAL